MTPQNKVLTISVAAYNVEDFIEECLQSFVIEDIMDQLEVLVIDDGSSDHTVALAKKYEEQYPSTFRIITKQNGGHGSTVNRGMKEATGAFFKTVDGDDWVEKEGLRSLVHYLGHCQTKPDIVVTDYHWVDWHDGKVLRTITTDFDGKQYETLYDFRDIAAKVYLNMHAVTFRTELLKDHPFVLTEHCFYVDAQYVLNPIPYVQTVVFLENPVYQYRLGMDGQSMNLANMRKNCSHHETVLQSVLRLYQNMDSAETEKKAYLAKAAARLETSQIKIYLSFTPSVQAKQKICDMEQLIKNQYPQVYRSCENKALRLLRKSHYILYGVASRVLRKQNGMSE